MLSGDHPPSGSMEEVVHGGHWVDEEQGRPHPWRMHITPPPHEGDVFRRWPSLIQPVVGRGLVHPPQPGTKAIEV